MWPVLVRVGPVELHGYAVCVVLAFVVGGWIRSREVRRLGYDAAPGHAWVSVGALLGAMVGAKLGLVLFGGMVVEDAWRGLWSVDFTGKTVLGGIAGGWLGVELAKKAVGHRGSTGDGFAVALLVGQAIGRFGCLLEGCCYGIPWDGPWAVAIAGAARHPVQLYEAGLDLVVAAWLVARRDAGWPAGHTFRRAVVGYAVVRALLDPLRGDGRWMWGPASAVQWACLGAAAVIAGRIWWIEGKGAG
ncbi:MAG: prolipoprotein diacylglyceryl transferase family protein [Myxococcota bacterium]